MRPMDIKEIASMLNQRIESLCAELLPMGRREGSEWVEASTSRGGLGDSLRVRLSGARAGSWGHFSNAGARGDALELIAYVNFNGDKKKAIEYARAFLGIDNADPKKMKKIRAKASAQAKKKEAEAKQEEEQKRRFAQSLWHNASPNLAGSPVDLYLLGRGIGLGDLKKMPGALRYHPSLKHPNGQFYPGMIAQINNGQGDFVGVHRTFLHSPEPGIFKKAPGIEAKLTLGRWAGGFIALSRGFSNRPLRDAEPGEVAILCEGIEDGLALALSCPMIRVLACINVTNFKNIVLPENITDVVIAADNDPETLTRDGVTRKHPARVSVQAAVDTFLDQGRKVLIAHSAKGKDFNDCRLEPQEGAA